MVAANDLTAVIALFANIYTTSSTALLKVGLIAYKIAKENTATIIATETADIETPATVNK